VTCAAIPPGRPLVRSLDADDASVMLELDLPYETGGPAVMGYEVVVEDYNYPQVGIESLESLLDSSSCTPTRTRLPPQALVSTAAGDAH
jgi:hypothetical protein